MATILLGALTIFGCASSPPTRYFTLDPIQPVAIASYQPGTTPIVIDKITLPATLDRPQIVRRVSANQLDIDENDRWPAPLDDIVQRVLAQDLAARMASGTVILPGEPLPSGAMRHVLVDVTTFEGDLSGHVVLHARWTVEPDAAGAPRASNDEYIAIDAGSGNADALAAGMSKALGELADRIAAAAHQPAVASSKRQN